jgi:hypothetical protein
MAARKQGISIEFSAFSDLIEQLEKLGANIEDIVADAMEQTAETVEVDTVAAMASANLPAGGKYSQGETMASIVHNAKAQKNGVSVEIDIGFDKTKPGAGGFLITGTPKMRPNYALEKIYGTKKYESTLKKDIDQLLQDEIDERLGS